MFWSKKNKKDDEKPKLESGKKSADLLEAGIIDFDAFSKVDLRVAKIVSAERVGGSDKLLKLDADLGNERRQILAGIGKVYDPESLMGKQIVIVANLEPRKIMGMESQGMVLATGNVDSLAILSPDKEVSPGSKIS